MANNQARVHKHFRLNAAKIKRAQRVFACGHGDGRQSSAHMDLLISEHKKNRVTTRANERFLASGAVIKDVYGNLEP